MSDQQETIPIFISSTIEDLIPYREKILKFFESEGGFDVHGYERFGSRDEPPIVTSIEEVKLCKIFIGILGMKYGSIDEKSGKSITLLEYETAIVNKLFIRMYIINEEKATIFPKFVDKYDSAKKLEEFKEQVKKEKTVSFFISPEDLVNQIERDVKRLLLKKDFRPKLIIPLPHINALTIFAAGDQSYYFGEKIKLAGTSTKNLDKIFLFLIGPNLDKDGVKLDSTDIQSISDNMESFTSVNVNSDHTWEYLWDTSKLPEKCESGNYTIFVISDPTIKDLLTSNNSSKVIIRIKNAFISGTASQSLVAQGDPIFFTGTAEGDPKFVYLWIFGKNYRLLQQPISVNKDASFVFTLNSNITKTLGPGQYFVIIQHPMRNKIADVTTTHPGISTNLIMINPNILGPGRGVPYIIIDDFSAPDAAKALIDFLNKPFIDDSYTKFQFIVQEPIIRIDPICDRHVGDKFTITATTNLAVGDNILFEVFSSSFQPTDKTQGGEFSGASGTVAVTLGTKGLNTLSFDVDASTFQPDEYIVKASALLGDLISEVKFKII
jgi:hypothetical protein